MTTETVNPVIGESAGESIEKIFGNFNFDDVVSDIVGGTFSPDSKNILTKIISLFLGELKSAFALIGSIAAIIIMSAFLTNLHSSFKSDTITKASGMAIFVYIAGITAVMFKTVTQYVLGFLGDVILFVHSIIPSLSALCVSGGEIVGATMAHPVVFFVCSCTGTLLKSVITPLVLMRAVCVLLCAVTDNESLNEFAELFAKLHKTLLSFSMSIFAGILGISSFAAASFDSLAARGVKFAISASVPVVGGSISEAMSSVAGSALLLRNAVGLGGVIVIFASFAFPLIKIWSLSLAFRLTSAFTAPITEKRVSMVLRKIGDSMDMLFSSIACMGTIMIIAIASIL